MKINCGKCKRELPESVEEFECDHMFCNMSNSVLLFGGLMGRRRKRNRFLGQNEGSEKLDRVVLLEQPDDYDDDDTDEEIFTEWCEEDTEKPTTTTLYHSAMTPEEAERMMWEGYGG